MAAHKLLLMTAMPRLWLGFVAVVFAALGSSAVATDLMIDALEFEAARGDPAAQTELATLYEHALFEMAARQGHPDATKLLAYVRFDPVDNINGGLAYLRWLLAFFQGDVPLVLAAYNAGEGAVERYRGIPPYEETRRYVRKITGMYPNAKHPYQAHIVEPSLIFARAKRGT